MSAIRLSVAIMTHPDRLVGRLPEHLLRCHLDALAGFADAAVQAGERAPRGERARLASTLVLDG